MVFHAQAGVRSGMRAALQLRRPNHGERPHFHVVGQQRLLRQVHIRRVGVGLRFLFCRGRPDRLPGARANPQHQRRRHRGHYPNRHLIPPNELPQSVRRTGRPGQHRLVVQVPLNVDGQPNRRVVAAGPVFFQALHDNPVQVAPQQANQSGRLRSAPLGRRRQFLPYHTA